MFHTAITRRHSTVFGVRTVSGGPTARAAGHVSGSVHLNHVSTRVGQCGTHSTLGGAVRDAVISGNGRHACVVISGRSTTIGTSRTICNRTRKRKGGKGRKGGRGWTGGSGGKVPVSSTRSGDRRA